MIEPTRDVCLLHAALSRTHSHRCVAAVAHAVGRAAFISWPPPLPMAVTRNRIASIHSLRSSSEDACKKTVLRDW